MTAISIGYVTSIAEENDRRRDEVVTKL